MVPETPLDSSPSGAWTSSSPRAKQGAFSSSKRGKAPGVRAPPIKRSHAPLVNRSPQKPETNSSPHFKRAAPKAPSPALKTVGTSSFYGVVQTQSFKEWDEDLLVAPAFLVEKNGKYVRREQVKKMEEQEEAIESQQRKVEKMSADLANLEKKNKNGMYQVKVDKMTIDLETLMDKLEYYKLEYQNMDADAYYFPGEMPIQIAPAKSVPGLGEISTTRAHCLVPRLFFRRTPQDTEKLQQKHTALVLAGEYHGGSYLVEAA